MDAIVAYWSSIIDKIVRLLVYQNVGIPFRIVYYKCLYFFINQYVAFLSDLSC